MKQNKYLKSPAHVSLGCCSVMVVTGVPAFPCAVLVSQGQTRPFPRWALSHIHRNGCGELHLPTVGSRSTQAPSEHGNGMQVKSGCPQVML